MKLSVKIAIFVLSGAIIAVIAVSFFAFTLTQSALRELTQENQLETTKQTMDKIDRLLYERYVDVQEISKEDVFHSYLSNEQGEIEIEDVERRLKGFAVVGGLWRTLNIMDIEGNIIASTDKREIGKTIEEYSEFIFTAPQILEGGVFFSDAFDSKETGRTRLFFTAPIRNDKVPGGPVIGVLIGDFGWPVVVEVLESVQGPVANLYNSSGVLIGVGENKYQVDVFTQSYRKNIVVKRVLDDRDMGSEVALSVHGNDEVLASYAPQLGYLDYPGKGWALVLETSTEIAFATAKQAALRLAILLGAIIILSSVVVLFIVNRSIVHPIRILMHTAQSITAGDLSKRASIKTKDEIGQMAEAFNEMTDSLVELSEAKTEFISIASHQLRTPATPIKWVLEELSENPNFKKYKKELQEALFNVKQLIRIINSLLNVSRIEKNTILYNTKKMQLENVIESLVKESKKRWQNKKLDVTLHKPKKPLPRISLDEERFSMAISNLIENAISYTDIGGKITLTIFKDEKNAYVRIGDTGIGIPEEDKERIFERLFRSREAMQMQKNGMGLGLYIAKAFLTDHGGELILEKTQEGGGSTFLASIPLRKEK